MELNTREIQIQWIEADSSNIKRYGWDPASATLGIEFNSGATYHYYNVPREVFADMEAADSQGVFLARVIKGSYEYGQV